MYEVKPLPRNYERNIYDAVYNFFAFGFPPGSYTTFMLLGDYKRAVKHAHPLLLKCSPEEMSTHEVLEHFFNDLPEFFTGENFHSWPGWVSHTDDQRELIRQSYSEERVREFRTYQALNGKNDPSFRAWIDKADETMNTAVY